MISKLLPAYYKAHEAGYTYTPLRTITVNNHEIAWMKLSDGDRDVGRSLFCECYFTEGVGWETKNGQIYTLDGPRKCLYRKAALHLRHLELRQEYQERFNISEGDSFGLHQKVKEIILDLIEKVKAGEFVEDGNGAAFWGGYFYLQTVGDVIDQFYAHLWEDIYELMAEKKIGLEGAVIQAYREPPPPEWEECLNIDVEGWKGKAFLPGHRKMAREWKLEVLKPDGTPAFRFLPGFALMHDPVFGPDVEDIARAEKELRKLIYTAKRKN